MNGEHQRKVGSLLRIADFLRDHSETLPNGWVSAQGPYIMLGENGWL